MFILVLKLILALVLTMIPFVFHYWIKPKSNESPKWKNSISILEENLPSIRRKKRIIFLWFMRFYKKMKFSRNARKFFTYIRLYSFCPWIAHTNLLAKYHRATVQEERQVTYTPKFGSEAFHL